MLLLTAAEWSRGLCVSRWQASALTAAVQKWNEMNSRARYIAQVVVACCRIIFSLHSSNFRRHLLVALPLLDSTSAKVNSLFWKLLIVHIHLPAYGFNFTDARQRYVNDALMGVILW